jgi:flagellar hook-associated protein 3 FlgL
MRITTLGTSNTMLNYILNTESRYYDLSQESASGLKVEKPSDDPTATKSLVNVKTQLSQLNDYLTNMSTSQNELNIFDDSMSSLTDLVDSTTSLTTQAASGTYSNTNMDNIKTQIDQIIQSVADIANTQYNGNYIFSGTAVGTKAYTVATDATGKITGITYNGTPSTGDYKRYTTISDGVNVAINTTGDQVFGSYSQVSATPVPTQPTDVAGVALSTATDANGNLITTTVTTVLNDDGTTTVTTGTGIGLMGTLVGISNSLGGHNQAAVGKGLDGLSTALDTTSVARTKFASVSNKFQITENSINTTVTQLTAYKSDLEDADLSQVLSDLTAQKTALDATYSVTSSLLAGKSLLDYI